MSDNLKGISEDVQFDWKTADKLVAELNKAAAELSKQIGERKKYGTDARKQWQGFYGSQFDGRLKTCTDDAKTLADAMTGDAKGLQELIKAAKQEQNRREKAREWVKEHNNENWFEKNIWDPITGGDEPPVPPRVDPPKIPIGDPKAKSRGSATPSRA